jgi:hypothetical protein
MGRIISGQSLEKFKVSAGQLNGWGTDKRMVAVPNSACVAVSPPADTLRQAQDCGLQNSTG